MRDSTREAGGGVASQGAQLDPGVCRGGDGRVEWEGGEREEERPSRGDRWRERRGAASHGRAQKVLLFCLGQEARREERGERRDSSQPFNTAPALLPAVPSASHACDKNVLSAKQSRLKQTASLPSQQATPPHTSAQEPAMCCRACPHPPMTRPWHLAA